MRFSLSVAVIVAVVASTLGGCGEDQTRVETVTVETAAAPSASPPAPPVVDPSPTPAEAEEYVEHFYSLIDTYRYREAWPLLPASIQQESGSFSSWKGGYSANFASRPTNVHPFGAQKDSVGIALDLIARDTDACNLHTVRQVFTGSWQFARAGDDWIPQSISMDKVAGDTPTLRISDCPDIAPAPYQGGGGGGGGHFPPPPTNPPPSDPPIREYGDLDCEDVGTNIPITGSDPNGYDGDGDGVGCES